MPRPSKLSHDDLLGGLLNVAFAQDSSPLEAIGFVKDKDGSLGCECVLDHTISDADVDTDIAIPEDLTYTLRVGEREFKMKHRLVDVGLGARISRLEADGVPACAQGDTIDVEVVSFSKGKRLRAILAGRFVVPGRRHPLGHPRGSPGYMVQVYEKNMLFVFDKQRWSFQGNLCEI